MPFNLFIRISRSWGRATTGRPNECGAERLQETQKITSRRGARVESSLSWLNGREGRRSVSLKDPRRYTRSESLSLSLSRGRRFPSPPSCSRRSRNQKQMRDTVVTRLVKSYFAFNRNANRKTRFRHAFISRSLSRDTRRGRERLSSSSKIALMRESSNFPLTNSSSR